MQSPPSAPPLRIGIAALLPSEPEHDVGSRPKLQTRDDDALAAVMAVRGIDPTSPNAYRNLALSFACELAAKNGRASPAISAREDRNETPQRPQADLDASQLCPASTQSRQSNPRR